MSNHKIWQYPFKNTKTPSKVVSDPIHKWTCYFCCRPFQNIPSDRSLEGMNMSMRLQWIRLKSLLFELHVEPRGCVVSAPDRISIAATSLYSNLRAATLYMDQLDVCWVSATMTCDRSRHDQVRTETSLETLKLLATMAASRNQTKRDIWRESQWFGVLMTLV